MTYILQKCQLISELYNFVTTIEKRRQPPNDARPPTCFAPHCILASLGAFNRNFTIHFAALAHPN